MPRSTEEASFPVAVRSMHPQAHFYPGQLVMCKRSRTNAWESGWKVTKTQVRIEKDRHFKVVDLDQARTVIRPLGSDEDESPPIFAVMTSTMRSSGGDRETKAKRHSDSSGTSDSSSSAKYSPSLLGRLVDVPRDDRSESNERRHRTDSPNGDDRPNSPNGDQSHSSSRRSKLPAVANVTRILTSRQAKSLAMVSYESDHKGMDTAMVSYESDHQDKDTDSDASSSSRSGAPIFGSSERALARAIGQSDRATRGALKLLPMDGYTHECFDQRKTRYLEFAMTMQRNKIDDLTSSLSELQQASINSAARNEGELAKVKANYAKAKSHASELKLKCEKSQRFLSRKQREIEKLTQELQKKRDEVEELKASHDEKLEALHADNAYLQKRVDCLHADIRMIQVKAYDDRQEFLREKDDQRRRLHNLEDDKYELKSICRQAFKEQKSLEDELEVARRQAQSAKEKMEAELKLAEIRIMHTLHGAKGERLSIKYELGQQLDEVNQELDELRERHEALLNDKIRCVSCASNNRSLVYQPCGHFLHCDECAPPLEPGAACEQCGGSLEGTVAVALAVPEVHVVA